MKKTTEEILKIVSDFKGKFNGALFVKTVNVLVDNLLKT